VRRMGSTVPITMDDGRIPTVRLGVGLLAVLLVTGCVAKPVASTSGPAGSTAPSYSGPAVITESALPADSQDGPPEDGSSDPEQPSDPVRTSAPTSAAGLADCALPYLRVSVRPAVVRSAHAGYLLTFTNTGQIACRLAGYPAVAVLSSAGQPVLQANPTPSGYLGGVHGSPTTVVIGTGQPASALLEGEQVDLRGERCPARPGLAITPPRSTAPARLPMATTICGGVQIHPVVAGTTGSSR
jgi:uncharacterized protein DUF4232